MDGAFARSLRTETFARSPRAKPSSKASVRSLRAEPSRGAFFLVSPRVLAAFALPVSAYHDFCPDSFFLDTAGQRSGRCSY